MKYETSHFGTVWFCRGAFVVWLRASPGSARRGRPRRVGRQPSRWPPWCRRRRGDRRRRRGCRGWSGRSARRQALLCGLSRRSSAGISSSPDKSELAESASKYPASCLVLSLIYQLPQHWGWGIDLTSARLLPPPVDRSLYGRAADPEHTGDVAEALAGQPKVSRGLLLSRRQLPLRPELYPVGDCPSATFTGPGSDQRELELH